MSTYRLTNHIFLQENYTTWLTKTEKDLKKLGIEGLTDKKAVKLRLRRADFSGRVPLAPKQESRYPGTSN